MIEICVFGALRLEVDGRLLGPRDLGGSKPRELLEVLLLARGALVSKEALAEALWPAAGPKNVAATLETYVSVLRRHLGPDRARARRLLVTSAGAYRVATDEVVLDVARFDDLLRRAERAGRRQRVALRTEALDLAAAGDLLEDATYAPWVEEERRRYRDLVAQAHLLVAEDLLVDGDLPGALRHAEASLRLVPLAEEGHRIVMLAHHALGHTERARAAFERCRTLLDTELGVDPTTETASLAGAIDAGAPPAELLGTGTGGAHRTVPAGRPDRRSPLGRMPFVGRTSELALVGARARASAAGALDLVVVEGRRGVGRTAFLTELATSLPGTVGRGAYHPLEAERPGLPLAGALVDALGRGPGAEAAGAYAAAPWLGAEAPALACLRDLLASHGPMVLLLDDLQWADPGTLDALVHLRREAPGLPLLVVATRRTPGPGPGDGHPLLDGVERIRLAALDVTSPELEGIDPALARMTGGDPGLLADCWRWAHGRGTGPSPTLRQTVQRTVRGLGGDHPALLRAAASLPAPFDLGDLLLAAGVGEGDLVAQVAHLCDLELLQRGPEGYSFRAAIVRDLLAEPASPPAPAATRGLSTV